MAAPPSVTGSAASSAAAPAATEPETEPSARRLDLVASDQGLYVASYAPSDVRVPGARLLSLAGVIITPEQAHARKVIGGEQVPRAHRAGTWAAARAREEVKSAPASPVLVGHRSEENVFVLIRGLPDLGLRGLGPFRYSQFKGYVEVGGVVSASCIFHGFFSVAEASEYWQAVYYDLPWPLLPPRP